MKKTALLVMCLALVVSAAAQELTEQDVEETLIMGSQVGAELRFAQLKSSIEDNIDTGEVILGNLLEKDPKADTTRLEEILSELEGISDEIENIDMSANSTELTEIFLTLKADARLLVSEFRDIAGASFTPEEAIGVKNQVALSVSERNQGNNTKIMNLIREYNAFRMNAMLKSMGLNASGSRSMGAMQAAQQVRSAYLSLGKDARAGAAQAILETRARERIQSLSTADTVGQMLQVRVQQGSGNGQGEPGTQGGSTGGSSSTSGSSPSGGAAGGSTSGGSGSTGPGSAGSNGGRR